MPTITRTFENPGSQEPQGKLEDLIGYLLGRGLPGEKIQQELLRAQLPTLQSELGRSEAAQQANIREQLRPLLVEKARLGKGAGDLGIHAAGIESLRPLLEQRLAEAQANAPKDYTSGSPVTFLQKDRFSPYYGIATTDPNLKTFGYTPDPTSISAMFNRAPSFNFGYNPAITAQQNLEGRLSAVTSAQQNLAANIAAQQSAQAAALAARNRLSSLDAVISAVGNQNLLPADVEEIRKIMGY